ncbi:hypothetical protein PV08_01173 [Exophiala spinifera]|uniref:C2H2-type domain-containing protein n=1 Tax=Exophiala spinifera TaxID=91928 RepID=A0A0D2BNW8_9EURO|nr:uncharacterized protein PV08_01173 [Exophiala spinifera]KIW20598.1 hypothetical protein PV08_01173 [Exophiala spinifera]
MATSIEVTQDIRRTRQCPYCQREFNKADHYHRHVRSHTKEKPFRCDTCKKSYPRHDTLLRHARTHQKTANRELTGKDNTDASISSASNRAASHPPAQYTFLPPYGPDSGPPELHTPRSRINQRSDQDSAPTGVVSVSQHQHGQGNVSAASFDDSVENQNFSNDRGIPTSQSLPSVSGTGTADGTHCSHLTSIYSHNTCTQGLVFTGAHDEQNSADWLLGHDFDLAAFGFPESDLVTDSNQTFDYDNDLGTALATQSKPGLRKLPRLLDFRSIWYTRIRTVDTGYRAGSGPGTITPVYGNSPSDTTIDEIYRVNMAGRLRVPSSDEPLPSIDFLNLCIHLFFTRFNVTLPMIHSPTFRPTRANALLVLSICSGGSISLGSAMANKAGSMLFERVNKAVLAATWDENFSHKPDHVRNVLKTSMIGQTFALLSGNPSHLLTAAAFHGSLISVARHNKLFQDTRTVELAEDLTPEELNDAWRGWARDEELKRIALVLFIHDAEVSALFHHEPLLRHNVRSLPTACSAELFSAPTAAIWATRYRAEQRDRLRQADQLSSGSFVTKTAESDASAGHLQTPVTVWPAQDHMLNVYTRISGISPSIIEARHMGCLTSPQAHKFESDLVSWYISVPTPFRELGTTSMQPEAPFTMLPLWHYSFIQLTADLDVLELAIGREGPLISDSTRSYALSWVASPDSKRCLLHALLLQNLMTSVNMGSFFPLHTARILFSAAVCWYCYMLYLPYAAATDQREWTFSVRSDHQPLESCPEVRLLREGDNPTSPAFTLEMGSCNDAISDLDRILNANTSEMKAGTLCVLEGVLRRLGTGGIARAFADIVQVFISGEVDKCNAQDTMHI